LRRSDIFNFVASHHAMGNSFSLGFAQIIGLCFTATFSHRFGEVCKQDRKPEPERDL